ncbi:helicase [Streptomyces sp. NPDC058603]
MPGLPGGTKSRRDKLTQQQLNALRELGVKWA